MTVDFKSFRVKRENGKIYVMWEQRMAADTGARLQVGSTVSAKKEGELVRVPVPQLSWSGRILTV